MTTRSVDWDAAAAAVGDEMAKTWGAWVEQARDRYGPFEAATPGGAFWFGVTQSGEVMAGVAVGRGVMYYAPLPLEMVLAIGKAHAERLKAGTTFDVACPGCGLMLGHLDDCTRKDLP